MLAVAALRPLSATAWAGQPGTRNHSFLFFFAAPIPAPTPLPAFSDAAALFALGDTDGNGCIDYAEFGRFLEPEIIPGPALEDGPGTLRGYVLMQEEMRESRQC